MERREKVFLIHTFLLLPGLFINRLHKLRFLKSLVYFCFVGAKGIDEFESSKLFHSRAVTQRLKCRPSSGT